jgi:hypothetical protein
LTKDVEQKTRKLTSGTAFYIDIVALHGDPVWNIQQKWNEEKKINRNSKEISSKSFFGQRRRQNCDDIRKRPRETWSVENIISLLAYKRQKNDPVIKKNKGNRLLMLHKWDRRSVRPTLPCSPIVDEIVSIGVGDEHQEDTLSIGDMLMECLLR